MREPVTIADELRIVYRPLVQCLKFPSNPKEHDLGAIVASIARFGFRDPITVNIAKTDISAVRWNTGSHSWP